MHEVVRWQLDHPDGTADQCKEFMIQAQSEGKLPTMESLGLMAPTSKKRKQAQRNP
jgi:hypothetical protein